MNRISRLNTMCVFLTFSAIANEFVYDKSKQLSDNTDSTSSEVLLILIFYYELRKLTELRLCLKTKVNWHFTELAFQKTLINYIEACFQR